MEMNHRDTETQRIEGTEIFRRLGEESREDIRRINLEVWSPTPWMIDVLTSDRERRIRNWCYIHFGPESSPIHDKHGIWRQSNVTMHGYCWFGFASEELMNRFLAQFPSPPKQ